ncbi:cytochrome P450 [Guyanagaster necrorhizus]|uniref:Cytochrome P450 n=1 Tax=Guyanagaster necrorhizus TaxID=856835 RepID=A0A9P7VFB8_9AGAR|nr:cytochrome P450 [Guyanagaster necrorhizus MCA 3950]KAG7439121.1 cytochrome P450 [Guyanagaster necrorhizus MCA 3950]
MLSYSAVVVPLVLSYVLYLAVYRLVFHRLKSFPGPRLAALTGWYQTYYEVFCDGLFVQKLEELHKIYGPVVRINPNELHFSNPQAYFSIYTSQVKFIKDPNFYFCFAQDESSFGFTDLAVAKKRRDVLLPFFSRRSILQLEGIVQSKVDTLLFRLRQDYTGKPVNLYAAFKSLTMDIITAFSYSHSFDALLSPDFSHPILLSLERAMPMMTTIRHFPILQLLYRLPESVTHHLDPDTIGFVQLRHALSAQIEGILKNPSSLDGMHETIYHSLLSPEKFKSGEIPSKKSLSDEAQNLLFGGTDTTGNTMTIGFFHIMQNPDIHSKLMTELLDVWPSKESCVSYQVLEKLPYLTAVIKESLRISNGVPVAKPRLVDSPTVIEGVLVPAGTSVGIGSTFILMNEDIFPDPHCFNPERWLQGGAALDKYLISFSRGPRACLGINLAWCELYILFANLLRKFDLKNHETKHVNFRYHFLPAFRDKHLHAIVAERE